MMHILFPDESGRPGDKLIAVGGVAVAADRWGELRAAWEAVLATHGWPAGREVKWRPGGGGHEALHGIAWGNRNRRSGSYAALTVRNRSRLPA